MNFEEVKQENRIVAGWLLNYDEKKKEYERKREEILQAGKDGSIVSLLAQGGVVGDITGEKAAELAELAEMEKWLALIEEVERKLPWKIQIFLRLRREAKTRKGGKKGRPSWIPYVQWEYAKKVAEKTKKKLRDCWVSGETLINYWNKIVNFTAREAAKRGLL